MDPEHPLSAAVPTGRGGAWRELGAGLGVAAASTLAAWLLRGVLAPTNLAMLYFPGVVWAAVARGRRAAVAAAVLSVAGFNFFFVPPYFTLAVESAEYLVTLAVMLLVGLVIGGLAHRLRVEAARARAGEDRARDLYRLGGRLADSDGAGAILESFRAHVAAYLGAPCLVLGQDGAKLAAAADAPGPVVDPDALRWVLRHGEPLGPGSRNWPDLPAAYLPLDAAGTRAVLVVAPPALEGETAAERHLHLLALCKLAAGALERAELARHARDADLAARGEAVRNTLLAGISHDLRTPLGSVLGAATTLIEQGPLVPEAVRLNLLEAVREEALRMTGVVDKLLQLARFRAGGTEIRRDWESLEEIAGGLLARRPAWAAAGRLSLVIPPDLPLLRVDGVLLGQVLSNLLENALRLSPPGAPVTLRARAAPAAVLVAVGDRGPGFPPGEGPTLFDRPPRRAGGGAGLGLALCKTLVEAHGGRIWARARPGGGASFRFCLPRDAAPGAVPEAPAEPIP